jgi:hypothetical protein
MLRLVINYDILISVKITKLLVNNKLTIRGKLIQLSFLCYGDDFFSKTIFKKENEKAAICQLVLQ